MSERALKERIIGAVVLVIFAVLVVPVFLDGPSDDQETVSEAVTLPGQNNQDRKQQTIVLDRDRSEPVPASRKPSEPANAVPETADDMPAGQPAQQQAVRAEVEDAPIPAPTQADVTPEVTSTTGMWAVQLGSFSSQENAERLAASLRDKGYAAFISQLKSGSSSLARVRIGPQKDRQSAETIAAELKKNGHNGQVVPHP